MTKYTYADLWLTLKDECLKSPRHLHNLTSDFNCFGEWHQSQWRRLQTLTSDLLSKMSDTQLNDIFIIWLLTYYFGEWHSTLLRLTAVLSETQLNDAIHVTVTHSHGELNGWLNEEASYQASSMMKWWKSKSYKIGEHKWTYENGLI